MIRHKPKNHRGRATDEEIWLFGIADGSFVPAKVYIEIIPDRTMNTLGEIIRRVCLPNTIIHSDGWRGYCNVKSLGFTHKIVNHTENFVNPIDGTHTQNIEFYWNKIKFRIKNKKGICKNLLKDYVNEWMWRDSVQKKDFQETINLIKI
jgi:hypothetical protein